jgi:hypothetical protein
MEAPPHHPVIKHHQAARAMALTHKYWRSGFPERTRTCKLIQHIPCVLEILKFTLLAEVVCVCV